MAQVGVIFEKATTINGRSFRAKEFAQFDEQHALALCNAGNARRADGTPATGRMVDADGRPIRAYLASVPNPIAKPK